MSLDLHMMALLMLRGQDLMVVVALLLLVFGGKKLPELAKGLGESIRNFKTSIKEDEGKPVRRAHASRGCVYEKLELDLCFLGRNNRILCSLGDAKFNHLLGWNLDRLAGRGIASRAGLPFDADQPSESREHEHSILLHFRYR